MIKNYHAHKPIQPTMFLLGFSLEPFSVCDGIGTGLQAFDLTRFLDAKGMLRWKTLQRATGKRPISQDSEF